MDGRRTHRGFTLIELATVMTVIAVMAVAVAGPTLSFVGTQRSRLAASRLANDLTYAQRRAINTGLRTWVVFDIPGNSYSLFIENLYQRGKANRIAARHPLTGTTAPIAFGMGDYAGVSLLSVSFDGGAELEFDSLGRPRNSDSSELAANGQITLTNGVTVTVTRVSGLVEQAG